MRYSRRLRETNDHIKAEHYRAAITTASGAIEHLLRELFEELLENLPRREAAELRAAYERALPGGRRKKMTFGNWVHFFQSARLFDRLSKQMGYELRYFNPGTLRAILDVRNECTHEDYEPTRAEAELVRNNLILFLKETERPFDGEKVPSAEAKQDRARGALPPWTTTVVPHRDIRDRRFDLGIFAIHLGDVVFFGGQPEYGDPELFFDLTYFTRGLRDRAVGMLRRLSGDAKASAVVHLHTTFGGGKTHTMLALYHLAKHGHALAERDDIRRLMVEARVEELPQAQVAVIDGDMLTPSNPRVTEDGITLHTLWGEIAYQLGGAELYELMRASDESRSAPGQQLLQEMLEFAGPSLILMDELLNYATKAASVKVGRKTYLSDQVSVFIKALTQAVDRQHSTMLVITMTSQPQEMFGGTAVELYQALSRVLGRVERTEVIAESTEIYEILRRRLFEKMGPEEVRRQVAAAYSAYYREHGDVFPEHALDPNYRQVIEASYPFHPELIDVLRGRWGTIPGFQKTRGVLRLLALVVSNLYRKNHGAPLIQVGHIDLADPEIRQQLLKHVDSPHRYDAVIGADVAGLPDSKAENIDKRVGRTYYQYGLCEGLATALFMYSHSGRLGENGATRPQLWLSVLQPGLEPADAADALDRFESESWYLERDGMLMRLGINPNLNMMLAQRIDAMRQEEEGIRERVYQALETMVGDAFGRPYIWPTDPRAVRDNDRLKLIVGPLDTPWVETDDMQTSAVAYIAALLYSAGSTHRQYQNTLVFVMPTPEGVENIKRAAIRLLALDDIARTARRQLTEQQEEEFQEQYKESKMRLPATIWGAYTVIVAPSDEGPWVKPEYSFHSYMSGDSLSQWVWERLKEEERLLERLAPDLLLMRDNARFGVLWPADQDYINVAKLWDYFARYPYLPMLAGPHVLQDTIARGVERGLFAYCLGEPEAGWDTVFFKQRVSADRCKVSRHAWLLSAEAARELLQEPEPGPEAAPQAHDAEGTVEGAPRAPKAQASAVGDDRYVELAVETAIDPLRWREFFRSVIQPLVQAGAQVNLTLQLTARHEEGFDPDLIELRVRESITQLDRDAQVRLARRQDRS